LRLSETGLDARLVASLRREGIETLYPHQVEAIKRGLLDGRNMVISAPTASGKTLLATLAAHRQLAHGRKVLYLTPLRALTTEKYQEFSRVFENTERAVSIAAVSGDYDDPGEWLGRRDFIVSTYEKADSLVRHRATWLSDVGLVVIDEVHMIGEKERGPTLEMTISKLTEIIKDAQILCLSATIRNVDEIAEWLDAVPIVSNFRPVPLIEGVVRGGTITLSDGATKRVKATGDPLTAVVSEGLLGGGQVLVFALTRRKAESYASKLAEVIPFVAQFSNEAKAELERIAENILESEPESPFSERLGTLVERGVAFHHAGLGLAHRRLVEGAFRSRILPVICATPTLAAGVNLPARLVVIPELRRYDSHYGPSSISVMEYKQLCGRAGRPMYDKVGYALLIARNKEEEEYFLEKYVNGEPEKIYSCLGSDRHLRSHILSLIASELVKSELGLRRILSRTFYAHQFGVKIIEERVDTILEFLEENGMIRRDDGVSATPLGRRVSQLYIDPLSAIRIVQYLSDERHMTVTGMLQVICMTPDLTDYGLARIRRQKIERYIESVIDELVEPPPDPAEDPEGYEFFLDALKNLSVLREWIDETPERRIYEDFNIEPGDFATLRERAEWLSYAASQLSLTLGRKSLFKAYETLTVRIKHGVKNELLELVSLPGIGRVRGRSLWNHGVRSLKDIEEASVEELSRIPGIGRKLAEKIKKSLSGVSSSSEK